MSSGLFSEGSKYQCPEQILIVAQARILQESKVTIDLNEDKVKIILLNLSNTSHSSVKERKRPAKYNPTFLTLQATNLKLPQERPLTFDPDWVKLFIEFSSFTKVFLILFLLIKNIFKK